MLEKQDDLVITIENIIKVVRLKWSFVAFIIRCENASCISNFQPPDAAPIRFNDSQSLFLTFTTILEASLRCDCFPDREDPGDVQTEYLISISRLIYCKMLSLGFS